MFCLGEAALAHRASPQDHCHVLGVIATSQRLTATFLHSCMMEWKGGARLPVDGCEILMDPDPVHMCGGAFRARSGAVPVHGETLGAAASPNELVSRLCRPPIIF